MHSLEDSNQGEAFTLGMLVSQVPYTNTVFEGQLPVQGESKKKGIRQEEKASGSCAHQFRACSPMGTGAEVWKEPRSGKMPSALPDEGPTSVHMWKLIHWQCSSWLSCCRKLQILCVFKQQQQESDLLLIEVCTCSTQAARSAVWDTCLPPLWSQF